MTRSRRPAPSIRGITDDPAAEATPTESTAPAPSPSAPDDLARTADPDAAAAGRAIVAEARAVRRRMLEDVDRRRAAVRADLLAARDAIDAALTALEVPAPPEGSVPPAAPATPAPAGPSAAATPPAGAPQGPAADVFARLRSEAASPPAPTPEAPKRTPSPMPDADASVDETPTSDASVLGPAAGEVADADGPAPASGEPPAAESPDDAVRARRDAVLAPLVPEMMRASKRLLQDEQNILLDAVRRARQRVEPSRLLPEPIYHRDAWAAVLAPAVNVAYASGRTAVGPRRKPMNAPGRVINELAAGLVAPLRERLTATIDAVIAEGPFDSLPELHRALASAISARYREWRSRDLEIHLGDVLAAAYARGAYDASPSGVRLRWVPDRAGQCPDCDDDALEHAVKGKPFPTGQHHPPAHPGCRCVVVPAPDSGAETANL